MADIFEIKTVAQNAPFGTASYGAGFYNGLIYICTVVNNKFLVYTYDTSTDAYSTYDLNATEIHSPSSNILYYSGCFYFVSTSTSSNVDVYIFKYDISTRTVTKRKWASNPYYRDIALYVYNDMLCFASWRTTGGSKWTYLYSYNPDTLVLIGSHVLSYNPSTVPIVAQSIDGYFANFYYPNGSSTTDKCTVKFGYATDTALTQITDFPVNIRRYEMFDYNGFYYICGGQVYSNSEWIASTSIYQVDKVSKNITECELSLPTSLIMCAATVVNNVAYLFSSDTIMKIVFAALPPDPTKEISVNITKQNAKLKTYGKYCDANIVIKSRTQSKSATPTVSQQQVTPDTGYIGLAEVIIGAVQTETKTITPTTSQQTFTPTSGKYFKQVICQAIQTETKTVAPSASAQTYSPSSGKYFANFTVSAVPSQSKTVTPTKSAQTVNADSGKWLSSVTVNPIPDEFIQPSGSQDITANGTYDVTDKASVNVNVPTASAVEEVATAAAMDALLAEANVGKYYKFTGTTDSNYTNGDLYLVEGGASTAAPKVSIKYTDDYVSGYIAYSLDNGATWSDYITTQTTLLTDVTQIKLKSRGLSAGLMIYKGPYGYNGESGVATTVVSPGSDREAYETENITITEDTGFYLYCYYD